MCQAHNLWSWCISISMMSKWRLWGVICSWRIEELYLKARSLCLQREKFSRERKVANILISLLSWTPDSTVASGVSYTWFLTWLGSFSSPFHLFASPILSCDHSPLSDFLLLIWVLPTLLPLHSHKPLCVFLLRYSSCHSEMHLLCSFFREKNYSCLPKIWNQQLIIPHLLYFKSEHGQGQGIISRLF